MAGSDDLDDPGGQLFEIDLVSGERRVIASAGRVGPAAQVVSFSVSPDGKSVAYAIATPEGRRWQFDSLWVKRLTGSAIERVPVDVAEGLGEIRWVKGGLMVERINADTTEWLFVTTDAEPRLVEKASPAGATPVSGTPVSASPVPGTPVVASPVVGTPVGATPEGTPLEPATPVASPVPASPVPATSRG
jgi:hypothetical protein